MNKNLVIVVSAMVFMILVLVMVIFVQSGTGDASSSADRIGSKGCSYQENRVLQDQITGSGFDENAGNEQAMTSPCSGERFESTQENIQVTQTLNN
jgi:hypothetical protein